MRQTNDQIGVYVCCAGTAEIGIYAVCGISTYFGCMPI